MPELVYSASEAALKKTPHPAIPLRGIATLSPGERVPEVRGRVRGHFRGFWVLQGEIIGCEKFGGRRP
jgi:hypothetical protein